jgi:hypothetical protein
MASDHDAKVTTNHEEIRRWVDERGGHPAVVKGTEILRIDYPGFEGEESLEQIPWEKSFEIFEKNGLTFLYQDKTASGEVSRFSKFIAREGSGKSAGA